jgi:hypothetical protein
MENLKYGFLHYFNHVDKDVKLDQYDPVSYDQWKMLRDLEPTKFRGTYNQYVLNKREQYNAEVIIRAKVSLTLESFYFTTTNVEDRVITQVNIEKIEANPLFDKWVNEADINELKNYINE